MNKPTKSTTAPSVRGLSRRDFHGYADRCTARSAIMGAIVRYHADAADGNSPDLAEWPDLTTEQYASARRAGVRTAAQATEWCARIWG